MFGRIAKLFKDPESSDSDINLLLLGGTGVGKSTFINSISNYFKYSDLKAAQKGKINVLIPVRLNISNSNVVCGDPDKNESHECGKSATQHVKVYLFPIKVDGKLFNLRIVDSPGVGDPRGIEQDNIHIDNILAYLATLKKLHGICFVMKSNETRFTSFIEYCLKQILTRLDKSACNNIIFITTYSKSAQYTAGETKIHCLEPLVRNIRSKPPHVDIPLNDDNVFSLDNEAFKALLEMQEGKSFQKNEVGGFAESWKVSSQECRRLLTYIIGDARTSPLQPHEVESTISINEVRFLIEQLATPIAEVSEIIQDNLLLLDRHKKNLNLETQTLGQLKQQLFIPCVDLIVTELNQPVTVCTDTKCAEVVKVNNVTEWHYQQKCHNPCYLEGIPREMVGDPGLINCAAMEGTDSCTQCGCNWRVHMHIYKTTEKIQTQKEDINVRAAITSKEDARVKIESLMKDLNKRMSELEAEGEVISESIARFSFFLQEHALTPFNDAYSDYIKQLIKNEKSLGKFRDPVVIEKLEKLLQKHEHLQKTLQQNAQKFNSMGGQPNLTPQAIKSSISNLYRLKHMGAKIEELIKKSTACRNKETQKNFSCVVSQQVDLNEDARSGEYGSEYSYRSSRSKHGRVSPRSEYYSEYNVDGSGGEYYGRYESERQYRAPPRSRHHSDSDEDVSYRSPMSDYYSKKSTISGHSSDSDSDGTVKYVSSSRSSKSPRKKGSDDDVSVTYASSSRSVRSSRSRHPESDDDVSVKYESSSRSVRSTKSRHPDPDDDASVKYDSSSRSVRSTKNRHPGDSDDDKSVRSSRSEYYSSDHRSKYGSMSKHTRDLDDKSVRSSRNRHSRGSDDEKSVKSSRSEYSTSSRSSRPPVPLPDTDNLKRNSSTYQSSSKSSKNRHSNKSVDENSVRSSRSEYYSSGHKSSKSEYSRNPRYDSNRSRDSQKTDNDKSEKSSRKSNKHPDYVSSRKSSSPHHKDKDTSKSVKSSKDDYYSKSERHASDTKKSSSRKNDDKVKKSPMSQFYSDVQKKEKSGKKSSDGDEFVYDSIESEE